MGLFYRIYAFARRRVNTATRDRIAGSVLLRPVRDLLIRTNGNGNIVGNWVEWNGVRFWFSAPYQTFYKASTSGIENIICRSAQNALGPGCVAVDVGANYGFISSVMAHTVGANGRVYSFEADERVHQCLTENIKHSGFSDRCTAIQAFVGRNKQEEYVALDDYFEAIRINRLDFVKIDVDGGDYDVLLGAEKTLSCFKPQLVVEMSDHRGEIVDFLRSVGYTELTGMNGVSVDQQECTDNLFARC